MTVTTLSDAHLQWCEDREAELMEAASYPYGSYEESVIDHADENGCLSHNDATRLLTDHGFTMEDVYADNNGVSWVALDSRNAEALLAWLGY
jgi:hypothetical protein